MERKEVEIVEVSDCKVTYFYVGRWLLETLAISLIIT